MVWLPSCTGYCTSDVTIATSCKELSSSYLVLPLQHDPGTLHIALQEYKTAAPHCDKRKPPTCGMVKMVLTTCVQQDY
jgi:hypothetical protein